MPQNSILSIFESKIGVAPGAYPSAALFSGTDSEQLDLIRSWLIAQGIPRDGEHGCGRSSAYTLRKAYQEPRYLNGWKRRLNGASVDISAKARRSVNAAHASIFNQLESLEDDDETKEQNAFEDMAEAARTTNLEPNAQTPDSLTIATEQIAKAADFVIGQRLKALQETLTVSIKHEVSQQKLELSADAREAIKRLVAQTATETAKAVIESMVPQRVEVFDVSSGQTRDLGIQHEMFPKLLRACQARLPNGFRPNLWLTGPAGSGKTTAVENVAKALDSPFASDGSLDADYKVLGFKNAQGEFVSTEFLRVFEHGGIYCADEIDNWLPSALLSLNSALANGWISTSRGMIPRHPNFIAIACANTWGLGATNEYVGRTKLDAASLDRFQPKIDWPIDEALEANIAQALGDKTWYKIVQEVRRNAKTQGLKIIISPRATYVGIALFGAGFYTQEIIEMTFAAGLSA